MAAVNKVRSWRNKLNDCMQSFVGIRSYEELCGRMISVYPTLARVTTNCIRKKKIKRAVKLRKLLQKLLILCHSIRKDLPESVAKMNVPLSYDKMASIFLTQYMNVTLLSRDIDKTEKRSTMSTYLFLLLDSSVSHAIEAMLNVELKILLNEGKATYYLPIYKKLMMKASLSTVNSSLYLRCALLSKQWQRLLPVEVKYNTTALLKKIPSESFTLKAINKKFVGNYPPLQNKEELAYQMLFKVKLSAMEHLLENFNKKTAFKLSKALSKKKARFDKALSSSLFFVDTKADASISVGFANANATDEEATRSRTPVAPESKTVQDEIDDTIANMKEISRKSKSQKRISEEEIKNKRKKFYEAYKEVLEADGEERMIESTSTDEKMNVREERPPIHNVKSEFEEITGENEAVPCLKETEDLEDTVVGKTATIRPNASKCRVSLSCKEGHSSSDQSDEEIESDEDGRNVDDKIVTISGNSQIKSTPHSRSNSSDNSDADEQESLDGDTDRSSNLSSFFDVEAVEDNRLEETMSIEDEFDVDFINDKTSSSSEDGYDIDVESHSERRSSASKRRCDTPIDVVTTAPKLRATRKSTESKPKSPRKFSTSPLSELENKKSNKSSSCGPKSPNPYVALVNVSTLTSEFVPYNKASTGRRPSHIKKKTRPNENGDYMGKSSLAKSSIKEAGTPCNNKRASMTCRKCNGSGKEDGNTENGASSKRRKAERKRLSTKLSSSRARTVGKTRNLSEENGSSSVETTSSKRCSKTSPKALKSGYSLRSKCPKIKLFE